MSRSQAMIHLGRALGAFSWGWVFASCGAGPPFFLAGLALLAALGRLPRRLTGTAAPALIRYARFRGWTRSDAMSDAVERERLDVDILFVGAGAATLAA